MKDTRKITITEKRDGWALKIRDPQPDGCHVIREKDFATMNELVHEMHEKGILSNQSIDGVKVLVLDSDSPDVTLSLLSEMEVPAKADISYNETGKRKGYVLYADSNGWKNG